jgi:hypothetical protein
VDDNYWQYYKWVNEMQKNTEYTPPVEQVLAMANLCPAKHGNVVFDARNLYNMLTQDNKSFADDCETTIAARGVKTNKETRTVVNKKLVALVQVYPNPSKGLINVTLPLLEKGDWKITVIDVYGKTVLDKKLLSATTQLNIAVAKGIYFANVVNNLSGKQFVSKLIIE